MWIEIQLRTTDGQRQANYNLGYGGYGGDDGNYEIVIQAVTPNMPKNS